MVEKNDKFISSKDVSEVMSSIQYSFEEGKDTIFAVVTKNAESNPSQKFFGYINESIFLAFTLQFLKFFSKEQNISMHEYLNRNIVPSITELNDLEKLMEGGLQVFLPILGNNSDN